MCLAVINVKLDQVPVPAGAAYHLLPKSIPSHPKGVDKKLLRHPYNKSITPPHHPSEQGLPWLAVQEQLRASPSPPRMEKTSWGWDLFFTSLLECNSDVRQFLIHPHTNLEAYVDARKKWHAQNITFVGCEDAKNYLLEVEQHAFMMVMLKLLATKGQSMLCPQLRSSKSPPTLRKDV